MASLLRSKDFNSRPDIFLTISASSPDIRAVILFSNSDISELASSIISISLPKAHSSPTAKVESSTAVLADAESKIVANSATIAILFILLFG